MAVREKELSGGKLGLIFGAFLAVMHLIWAIMVGFGMAQGYVDWIFKLHFMNNPFIIGTFDLVTAIYLLIVTFVIGYILGWIFAWVHNSIHKS